MVTTPNDTSSPPTFATSTIRPSPRPTAFSHAPPNRPTAPPEPLRFGHDTTNRPTAPPEPLRFQHASTAPHAPTRHAVLTTAHRPPRYTTPHSGIPLPETDRIAPAAPLPHGKYTRHVPLPTLPLPYVDSPFPLLPENRLADALSSVLDTPQPVTSATEFRFEWSLEAAAHNLDVLRRYSLDLGAALRAQPFSALTPGSEFRSTTSLAPFLSMHPLWPHFQERISEGAAFPLRAIADSDRLADVSANLARGNHKSALGHETKLISMLKDEVERGWQLPLPREAALEIKDCEVAPLGMVVQSTIDEKGQAKEKFRLTHDQSFNPGRTDGRSVNDRVDSSQLTVARFGKAFSRLIYHISFLRQLYPNVRILLTKVDWKSAYRRIHLKAITAVKSCTSVDGLLLVVLRMTFGGSPNPAQLLTILQATLQGSANPQCNS